MCAMGMGSYLSKYVRTELFDWFVFVEIGVGILGGTSSLLLFLANIYVQSYQLVMYLEIILIGMLVGLEIPLLTRIIEENAGNLRITLSSIFSFDYIGRAGRIHCVSAAPAASAGIFFHCLSGGQSEPGHIPVYSCILPRIHQNVLHVETGERTGVCIHGAGNAVFGKCGIRN